jgi:long-chain acyl-CoA synthetase
MSEVSDLFHTLPGMFQKANVKTPRTFYFALDDDEKWTVNIGKDACEIKEGKPAQDADCYFKGSKQMFLDVWNGRYTPSAKDFLMGTIKSNNPLLLKDFIAAFKR